MADRQMWAMLTKQGTAMPETALCSADYQDNVGIALKNGHASKDLGSRGFRKVTDNPELACIICGWSK